MVPVTKLDHTPVSNRMARWPIDALQEEGFARSAISLAGFGQGGCLALQFAAREGAGLSAVFGLSAGLIGSGDGEGPPRDDLYGFPPKRLDYRQRLDGPRLDMSVHELDAHPARPLRPERGASKPSAPRSHSGSKPVQAMR